jgi:SAM-dependent methyltransferase
VAKPTVTDDDLHRFDEEREQADRSYNEALTRVDRALVLPVTLPGAPPPPEHGGIGRLNELWQIVPGDAGRAGGWRDRLRALLWRAIGPAAQRQQAFNTALVQHLNQQLVNEQQARAATAALIDAVRREFDALARFQTELIQYLQQVTPYVDTKDRRDIGLLRRQFEERAIALAAGLNGVTDEMLKRWESAVVREQRFATQMAAVVEAQDEIRGTLAGLQRTGQALKREFERLLAQGGVSAAAPSPAPSAATPPAARPDEGGADRFTSGFDSGTYLGFEDTFRGSSDTIRARVADYLPLFEGASDVLDVGCGRGEFLELLAAKGIRARGVDVNHAMVERCREQGLDVVEGDAVSYLDALPEASLGGLLAVQVVEHLQAGELVRLLELAYHKLRPGARIALETINPACWYAFFASYIRDITHAHPVHPDTLRYLLLASGFQRVEIRFREPYPEHRKLQPVPAEPLAAVAPALRAAGETFNENVEKINALLFTYLDYAAVAEKL